MYILTKRIKLSLAIKKNITNNFREKKKLSIKARMASSWSRMVASYLTRDDNREGTALVGPTVLDSTRPLAGNAGRAANWCPSGVPAQTAWSGCQGGNSVAWPGAPLWTGNWALAGSTTGAPPLWSACRRRRGSTCGGRPSPLLCNSSGPLGSLPRNWDMHLYHRTNRNLYLELTVRVRNWRRCRGLRWLFSGILHLVPWGSSTLSPRTTGSPGCSRAGEAPPPTQLELQREITNINYRSRLL